MCRFVDDSSSLSLKYMRTGTLPGLKFWKLFPSLCYAEAMGDHFEVAPGPVENSAIRDSLQAKAAISWSP